VEQDRQRKNTCGRRVFLGETHGCGDIFVMLGVFEFLDFFQFCLGGKTLRFYYILHVGGTLRNLNAEGALVGRGGELSANSGQGTHPGSD